MIFGWGTDSITLGSLNAYLCDICKNTNHFKFVLKYGYFHIFWIFGMVTNKQYLGICPHCNNGFQLDLELDQEEIVRATEKNPIPFMRRYGLAIFGGLIVIALLSNI